MRTVAQTWESFAAEVLPSNASSVQRQEMRRSFYAGFFACLMAGLEMAGESGDNDDVGATMMQRLHDECHAFARDVAEGRA